MVISSCGFARTTPQRFEFRQIHMGVEARIALYASDEQSATRAAGAAFQRIATLDSLMSDYRSDSELTLLSRSSGGPPVRVSEPMFEVLSLAQELARLSDGAFDVTAGPYVRLWRSARRAGALPDSAELRRASERVGWRWIKLDAETRTVHLTRPRMQLDLGGIAKGYAADAAIEVLRASGIRSALVEMGGDIVVSGPPPGSRGWRITVADAAPGQRELLLSDAAVSTSGDTQQFVEIDGRRYSHVVDPRTGIGLQTRVAATVMAPTGVLADALSTLVGVLGPEPGYQFLRRHFPGTTASIRSVSAEAASPGP